MKLSLLQTILQRDGEVKFSLPDKKLVPCHCHVTEVAKINKEFYDCGGNKRKKQYITIQLWIGDDHEHRLTNEKLYHILDNIDESDKNLEVFVEYECSTVGLYAIEEVILPLPHHALHQSNMVIQLIRTNTNCLAPEKCGLNEQRCKTNCC